MKPGSTARTSGAATLQALAARFPPERVAPAVGIDARAIRALARSEPGGAAPLKERIDLAETGSFGERTLTLAPDLTGQKWVRVAAWDIAANGSFTQLVWLVGPTERREP